MNMDRIVISWLVIETTKSPPLLGVTVAARFAPMTLGAFLGIIVDKISRRKLLILIQAMHFIMSLAMGAVITFGSLQFWQTIIASLISGFGLAIGMPARSVLTIDIVGTASLSDATALTMIAMNSMGFVGPALVAVLINWVGIGPFYFLMMALYTVGMTTIYLMRVSETIIPTHQSAWKNLKEGLKYHGGRRDISSLQLIALIANIFLFPMIPDLLVPIVAKDVLQIGASGYGWLMAAFSLGLLIGSFCILALANFRRKGLLAAVDSILWGPTLWLFSNSTWYPLSLLMMFAFGVMMMISMALIEVLLLTNSPPEMRGRVMGIRMQVITCEFISNLIWGVALGFISAPLAGQINSVLFTISMIGITVWAPSLKKME